MYLVKLPPSIPGVCRPFCVGRSKVVADFTTARALQPSYKLFQQFYLNLSIGNGENSFQAREQDNSLVPGYQENATPISFTPPPFVHFVNNPAHSYLVAKGVDYFGISFMGLISLF